MRKQTALRSGREPLQISVPAEFSGERSSDESEIFLSTQLHPLTLDEIEFCQLYLKTLPYPQSLVFGAILLDPNDPLLQVDHDRLTEIEKQGNLPVTRYVRGSGERSIYERVLIIREQGFMGSGLREFASA